MIISLYYSHLHTQVKTKSLLLTRKKSNTRTHSMSNILAKNFNSCFSLLKRPQPQMTYSPQHHQHTINYNSLFEDSNNNSNNNKAVSPPHTTTTSCFVSAPASPSSASTDYMEEDHDIVLGGGAGPTTPDLTAAYASQRFFISSPGRSNSIIDTLSPSSSAATSASPTAEVAGGVAVQTYSPDPYVDFRQSMQEMVEARELGNLKVKQVWEYLQELLLSYLALNPKNTHKYIVGAFTDLVVSLMSPNHNDNGGVIHPSSSSLSSSSSSFSSCGGGDHIGSGYDV